MGRRRGRRRLGRTAHLMKEMIRKILTYYAGRLDEYLGRTHRQPEGLATVGLIGTAAEETPNKLVGCGEPSCGGTAARHGGAAYGGGEETGRRPRRRMPHTGGTALAGGRQQTALGAALHALRHGRLRRVLAARTGRRGACRLREQRPHASGHPRRDVRQQAQAAV